MILSAEVVFQIILLLVVLALQQKDVPVALVCDGRMYLKSFCFTVCIGDVINMVERQNMVCSSLLKSGSTWLKPAGELKSEAKTNKNKSFMYRY